MLSPNLSDVIVQARIQLITQPNKPVYLLYDLANLLFGIDHPGAKNNPPADGEPCRPVYLATLHLTDIAAVRANADFDRLAAALIQYAYIVSLASRNMSLMEIYALNQQVQKAADQDDPPADAPVQTTPDNTVDPEPQAVPIQPDEPVNEPAPHVQPENMDEVHPEPL